MAGSDEKLGILHGCVLQNSMAKIEDVADTIEFGGELERSLADFICRAKQDCGIEITLNGDAGASKASKFSEGHAPIDAEDIGAGFNDRGEEVVGGLSVIDGWNRVAEARDDILNGRKNEFGVVAEIKLATPGVEKLDSGHASLDLRL